MKFVDDDDDEATQIVSPFTFTMDSYKDPSANLRKEQLDQLSWHLVRATAWCLTTLYVSSSDAAVLSCKRSVQDGPGDQRWQETSDCSVEDWQKILATSGNVYWQLCAQ